MTLDIANVTQRIFEIPRMDDKVEKSWKRATGGTIVINTTDCLILCLAQIPYRLDLTGIQLPHQMLNSNQQQRHVFV